MNQNIAFKRGLGFKQQTEESLFVVFDRFTIQWNETIVGITKELAEDWMAADEDLSGSYKYHRAVLLNQFASFLNEKGIRSYLMQLPRYKPDFTPYIYSPNEISRIFEACDSFRIKKGLRSVIFMLPALISISLM